MRISGETGAVETIAFGIFCVAILAMIIWSVVRDNKDEPPH